jgi:membrane-associated protein
VAPVGEASSFFSGLDPKESRGSDGQRPAGPAVPYNAAPPLGTFMNTIRYLLDLFVHLDKHLAGVIQNYGAWTYGILFLIIFCETGLVVTPFLPGDSLLFAAGAFAHKGQLNPHALFALLAVAAIAGDTLNYHAGYYLGKKAFTDHGRWLKKEHLGRAHAFYEKYGGKAIVLARFVPIVRTFAPFVAGIARMNYAKFLLYNAAGGVAWVAGLVYLGFWFSRFKFVDEHFEVVILAIVFLSILPMAYEFWVARKALKADPGEEKT